MLLIPYLSHMPFYHGEDLWFCRSDGYARFSTQDVVGDQPGVVPQSIGFQPWRIAKIPEGGVVSDLEVVGLQAISPTQVFCNPVIVDGILSFVHLRTLWKTPIADVMNVRPTRVKTQVFCGFVQGDVVVSAEPKIREGVIRFEAPGGAFSQMETPFQSLVRIVPHNGVSLIVTGSHQGEMKSALWSPEAGWQRMTANGSDLYKCVIKGENVIHAKREGEFEERYLHIDPLELSDFDA